MTYGRKRGHVNSTTARSHAVTIVCWLRYGLFVGTVWLIPLHAVAQTWVPTDISVLGGAASGEATAVSDTSTVVGTYPYQGYTHGFIWTGGTGWKDMGTFGGFNGNTSPQAVNTAGYIAGYGTTPDFPWPNNSTTHAFWRTPAGAMVDIGTLGGTTSHAYGINDAGQVVGNSETSAGNVHAFLWTPGSNMRDLHTLAGYFSDSYAYDINDVGQVVGGSRTASGTHAFLWSGASGMVDLGTLGGTASVASSVNEHGQVVGSSQVAG